MFSAPVVWILVAVLVELGWIQLDQGAGKLESLVGLKVLGWVGAPLALLGGAVGFMGGLKIAEAGPRSKEGQRDLLWVLVGIVVLGGTMEIYNSLTRSGASMLQASWVLVVGSALGFAGLIRALRIDLEGKGTQNDEATPPEAG